MGGLTDEKSHLTMPRFSIRRLWMASNGEITYGGVLVPEPPPVIKDPF
jgi:hypothetical protein